MRQLRSMTRRFSRCLMFFFFIVLPSVAVLAQPSGGPYGPVDQKYEVPKATHVYYVAPDGKSDSPGTTLDQPTTIESAIGRVVTSDAIILRGGVYRAVSEEPLMASVEEAQSNPRSRSAKLRWARTRKPSKREKKE